MFFWTFFESFLSFILKLASSSGIAYSFDGFCVSSNNVFGILNKVLDILSLLVEAEFLDLHFIFSILAHLENFHLPGQFFLLVHKLRVLVEQDVSFAFGERAFSAVEQLRGLLLLLLLWGGTLLHLF